MNTDITTDTTTDIKIYTTTAHEELTLESSLIELEIIKREIEVVRQAVVRKRFCEHGRRKQIALIGYNLLLFVSY